MKTNKKQFNLTNYIIKIENDSISWAIRNRYKVFSLLALVFMLLMISRAPYINLFFTKHLLTFMTVVLALLIFKLSGKKVIFLALIIIVIAIPFLLFKRFGVADSLGNFAYGILFLGVLRFILDRDN